MLLKFDLPYLDSADLKKLFDTYQLTEEQRNEVNRAYVRMLHEISDYVINNNYLNRRAKRELLTYGDTTMEALFASANRLNRNRLSSYLSKQEVINYKNEISVLLNVFISHNPKLKKELSHLVLLLIEQAKHPYLFDESIKEKFVRYTAHTLVSLVFIEAFSTAMSPVMVVTAGCALLASISLCTSLIFATAVIITTGLLYHLFSVHNALEKTGYESFLEYEYDKFSRFFFTALETFFQCTTYEFEMTRVLKKGEVVQVTDDLNIVFSEKEVPDQGHLVARL
jgi:hypothetical protein